MLEQYSTGPLSPGLDFRLKHPSLDAIPINNFGDMTTDLDGDAFALTNPTSKVSKPDGIFETISDVRHGLVDYTDVDSISSSGNSCEEDFHERVLLLRHGRVMQWEDPQILLLHSIRIHISMQMESFSWMSHIMLC